MERVKNNKIVEIYNLFKSYKYNEKGEIYQQEKKVLDRVTLSVNKGEFISFFGPNGCGKTTLLYCIAGVIEFDKGEILINGNPPQEANIGFVFQNYRDVILPWLTCLNNIALPLELKGIKKEQRRAKIQHFLKQLEINIPLERYPYELSGGQQQLIAIVRALVSNPDLLLMDEPLSSLDFQTTLTMRRKILNIWQKTGKTILHVSHNIDESVFLSDRVVLLGGHPTSILRIFDNNLPRPRDESTMKQTNFFELKNEILSLFLKEIQNKNEVTV